MKWLLEGDLNTKFWNTIANNRHRKNWIYSLEINNHMTFDVDTLRQFLF